MGGVGDSILWPFRKDQDRDAKPKGRESRTGHFSAYTPVSPRKPKDSFPSQSESEAKLRSAVGKVPQGAWRIPAWVEVFHPYGRK